VKTAAHDEHGGNCDDRRMAEPGECLARRQGAADSDRKQGEESYDIVSPSPHYKQGKRSD
jgi:hypothetical protein